jgi:hypothetical protein
MRYLTIDFFGNYCNILLTLSLSAFFDLLLENWRRYLNSLIPLNWGSFLKIQYVINRTDRTLYILFYLLKRKGVIHSYQNEFNTDSTL